MMHSERKFINIRPEEIDARSLRSGGATAMLCAEIDKDLTQLQGRWKSDAMIRYLHISAAPIVDSFAHKMFESGDFSFFPGLNDEHHGYAYTYDEPDPADLPITQGLAHGPAHPRHSSDSSDSSDPSNPSESSAPSDQAVAPSPSDDSDPPPSDTSAAPPSPPDSTRNPERPSPHSRLSMFSETATRDESDSDYSPSGDDS